MWLVLPELVRGEDETTAEMFVCAAHTAADERLACVLTHCRRHAERVLSAEHSRNVHEACGVVDRSPRAVTFAADASLLRLREARALLEQSG